MTLTPLQRAIVADLLGADVATTDGEAIAAASEGLRADIDLFRAEATTFLEREGGDLGDVKDD